MTGEIRMSVGEDRLSALCLGPPRPRAACVVAHGAGAGMRHPFMTAVAEGLAARGIASLRYQFPYMEAGRARPDPPARAVAAVRAAVEAATARWPTLPLFAGGKSFGGRMTSTAAAEAPLPAVRGLFFLGFPLHPPGRPSQERGAHLTAIDLPMLFLEGTRDDFADLTLLRPLCERLGNRAALCLFEGADHSFHVRKASGTTDREILEAVLDALAAWVDRLARR